MGDEDSDLKPVTGTFYVRLKGERGLITVYQKVDFRISYAEVMARKAIEIGRQGVFDKSGKSMIVYYPPREIQAIEYDRSCPVL
jgi:hypothetical protein